LLGWRSGANAPFVYQILDLNTDSSNQTNMQEDCPSACGDIIAGDICPVSDMKDNMKCVQCTSTNEQKIWRAQRPMKGSIVRAAAEK
jgi:hypothetical protein